MGNNNYGYKKILKWHTEKNKTNKINPFMNFILRLGSHTNNSIVAIVLFFMCIASNAQIEPLTKTDQYIITKRYLSVEDGLAGRSVMCAVEDKDGFMWFGTSNGLSRYDGNSCKTFTKQNFGLLTNEIAALNIDENNHLIITFNNKNLNENDERTSKTNAAKTVPNNLFF